MCYQTSQHNWVIIKMLYRCLRKYLLGWHRSRLGFVTPCIGEVSLGPLGNAHHYVIRILDEFQGSSDKYRSTGGLSEPPGETNGPTWAL